MYHHLRWFGLCCAAIALLLFACSPSPTVLPAATVAPASLAASTAPNTPFPEGEGRLVFSSDRSGAYADLYTMDLDGSDLALLAQGEANLFAGPWSPDGQRILYTGFGLTHSYVGVMNADGSGQTDLSQQPDSDEGFPAWSPDGQRVAFTSRRDGSNEIYAMGADGSNPTRLTQTPGDDFAPAWSPDGKHIAFVSDRDREEGIYSLYVMAVDGSDVRRLTDIEGSDYSPAWSPDGTKIAFRSDHDGLADIYVVHADGSDLHNLTSNQGANWAPAWAPDGQQLIFQTNRDGNWEIYAMNADGSNPRNLTQNPADDQYPYLQPISYSDPFAYCAAVGTVDMPDGRYDGPEMPDSVIQGLVEQGVVSADAPAEFQKHAVWRCMDGQVWACHYGANLPCQEKADTSQVPTSEMESYCEANTTADSIPAAVTGRATVYEWGCEDGKPQAIKRVFQADPQGYLADFWYMLKPVPVAAPTQSTTAG